MEEMPGQDCWSPEAGLQVLTENILKF